MHEYFDALHSIMEDCLCLCVMDDATAHTVQLLGWFSMKSTLLVICVWWVVLFSCIVGRQSLHWRLEIKQQLKKIIAGSSGFHPFCVCWYAPLLWFPCRTSYLRHTSSILHYCHPLWDSQMHSQSTRAGKSSFERWKPMHWKKDSQLIASDTQMHTFSLI